MQLEKENDMENRMGSKIFRIVVSLLVALGAFAGIGLCVYHYGQGVASYYYTEIDTVPEISEVIYLEEGTSVEQDFTSDANYVVGLDLILIGTGNGNQGTLYIQLYNQSGELLSQKREQLADIEPGQFYPIRFLDIVNVDKNEAFTLKIYVEDAVEAPGVLAISPSNDVNGNLSCRVDGNESQSVLLIKYLYGRLQYVGYEWKTNGTKQVLTAAVILIIALAGCVIWVINHYRQMISATIEAWRKRKKYEKSLMGLLWFIFLFLNAASVFKLRYGDRVPAWVGIYDVLLIALTGFYLKNYKIELKNGIQNNIRIFKEWELVWVIAISTVIRIPLFVQEQMWDAGIYYSQIQQACDAFDFSLMSIWSSFRLCAHYSIAYTMFMSIGEFLLPGNMTGVFTVTLILTDAAIACIYIMLRNYWLNLDKRNAMLATLLISVCPLFLGLFCNVTLDSLLIVFAIFLLYAEYRENRFMISVWLLVIVQTKETGVIIVGGYLLTHIVICAINTMKRDRRDRLRFFFSDYSVICSCLGVILLCIYTLKQQGMFAWLGMSNVVQGNLFTRYLNDIVEYPMFFWLKFKLLFVIHFQWIPTLIILFCVAWKKFIQKKKLGFPGMASYLGILIVFLVSNVYLFMYSMARYHIFSAVMMWILAIIVLFKTFPDFLASKLRCGMTWGILVIVFLQNFFYLDPITNMTFESFDTGNGKILSTEIAGGNFGDGLVNNVRHVYLFDLMDGMLADGQYDENTQVVVPYDRDYNMLYYGAGYDRDKQKRVHDANPDGQRVVPIEQVLLPELLQENVEEMPLRGIMYFSPYIDCDEQERVNRVKEYYDVSEPRDISNWGGSLRYYILTKK